MVGGTCQQGAIVLNPLVGVRHRSQNFDGILLGDCTGNWTQRRRASASAGRDRSDAGAARKGPPARFTVPIYVQTATPFQPWTCACSYDDSRDRSSAPPRAAPPPAR